MEPTNLVNAFSVWAAVVALIGGAIVFELARLRAQFAQLSKDMNRLTVHFEHRLTKVEVKIGLATSTDDIHD